MKAYRLGNDINFQWTINGLDDVSGTKVVKLIHGLDENAEPETITYSISGDVVTGLFKGKDQTKKGEYRLLLVVNNGLDDMITLDYVDCWELTGVCNFGISSGSDEGSIESISVDLTSSLDTSSSSHQDISGKANKVSSPTNGNFAGLDSNGDLTDSGSKASDFETVTTIEAPVDQTDPTDPITTLTCEVGKYYRIAVAIETLAVTLPAMTDTTHLKTITLFLTGGTTPAITFASATSGVNAYKAKGFTVESGKTYEISCLWNGVSWIVTQVEIELS